MCAFFFYKSKCVLLPVTQKRFIDKKYKKSTLLSLDLQSTSCGIFLDYDQNVYLDYGWNVILSNPGLIKNS
jgi:hypothetical protein